MFISSLHNPRVKEALKLRDRKGREQQGRIIIDGAREVERAVAAGVELDEIYYDSHLLPNDIRELAFQASAVQFEVTRPVLEKLSFGDRADGIVATARTPQRKLIDLKLGASPLVAVLASVEKPGNIGAVVRSADGAGVSALIVADGGTDVYNPNVIRASLGVVFSLPTCSATSAETIAWLRERRINMFAARVDGALEYTAADFRGPAAIILGSEAAGLSTDWNSADVASLKVPMLGWADSLNVSCTAAVLFYEALRQRRG